MKIGVAAADPQEISISVTLTTTIKNWGVIRQNVSSAFPELAAAIERAEKNIYELGLEEQTE